MSKREPLYWRILEVSAADNQPATVAGARESIRFLPPLNVSKSEIAEALKILEASLEEVFA